MFNLLPKLYDVNISGDRRVTEIIEESKNKISEYYGIPKYLLNLKYKIAKLPEFYEIGLKRIGSYVVPYLRKIGKVLGAFSPYKNEIYIDPLNIYNERYLKRTITHELVHKAQSVLGKIYRLPRYLLEREAHSVTQKLA